MEYAWLIPVLPLAAFLIIVGVTYRNATLSAAVAILTTVISLVISLNTIVLVAAGGETTMAFNWFQAGQFQFELGFVADPMSSLMYVIVTTVALLVLIYSLGYMHGDSGFSRYFAFLCLFVFSMLGLVASNNFLQIFIFWELVGLCSYLLIGFWYDQSGVQLPPPVAGMRAFITTRIGDVGFLLGILLLTTVVPSLNFEQIFQAVEAGKFSGPLLTAAGILIFTGAVGKSAQFPLHVWLPDAMEGPTPVSALIHAATMVAAGVYLVARVMPIVAASQTALLVIAYVGGLTAIFAASIAVAMTDFKRVIAYSTISQLGYMIMALGITGAATAGMFHLTTHAFFKALLFLGIGSIMHGAGSQEMKDLGGVGKKMKITATTFLIGSLALAGVPPLSGFWSKDEIVLAAFAEGHFLLGVVALAAAFLTAFYIFRVYFVTFWGERPKHMRSKHVHESPATMTLPLVVLSVLAIVVGFAGTPWANYFAEFMGEHHEIEGSLGTSLMVVSTIVALSAIFLSWMIYGRRQVNEEPLARWVPGLYKLLANKWYVENLYYNVIVKYAAVGLAYSAAAFDRGVIDWIVNAVAEIFDWAGSKLRSFQAGYLQRYAILFFAFTVVVLVYITLYFTV